MSALTIAPVQPFQHQLQVVQAVASRSYEFDYVYVPISEIRVETVISPKTKRPEVKKVFIQDQTLYPTDRFWVSLFSRYGFNKAFFKYYNHAEVFERISQVEQNDQMRVCIERDSATGYSQLLGVSNPSKPIVDYTQLMEVLGTYGGHNVQYANGIVTSMHAPRMQGGQFRVANDTFRDRFMMASPIDGYGQPNMYLSLLRDACQNVMVGYSKTFKSGLSLGKAEDDVSPAIIRAIDGFNNDEGFAALRQRVEAAADSWCSVYESTSLYKLLVKLHSRKFVDDTSRISPLAVNFNRYLRESDLSRAVVDDDGEAVGSPILKAFHAMTGDTCRIYGLANLDALSVKRQRTLGVNCTVYDAINFATEVATHHAEPLGAVALYEWVGNLVADEFDLELTKQSITEFSAFMIEQKAKVGISGSIPDLRDE